MVSGERPRELERVRETDIDRDSFVPPARWTMSNISPPSPSGFPPSGMSSSPPSKSSPTNISLSSSLRRSPKSNPSESTDDMDRILSPSEDGSFFPTSQDLGACSSTDSIIRRVEEEIANAKKASLLAKTRLGNHVSSASFSSKDEMFAGLEGEPSSDGEPSVDMHDILDTNDDSDEERKYADSGSNSHTRPQSPDDHFQSAMDAIGEEFDTPSTVSHNNVTTVQTADRLDTLSSKPNSNALLQESIGNSGHPVSSTPSPTLEFSWSRRTPEEMLDPVFESIGDVDSNVHRASLIEAHSNESETKSPQLKEEIDAGKRARAILDTLKSRREHFSSTFRSSRSPHSESSPTDQSDGKLHELSATSPSLPSLSTTIESRREQRRDASVADDEKKDDDSASKPVTAAKVTAKKVSLPAPDKKKFKSRQKLAERRPSSTVEEAFGRKSRRIRFRDPFPVLKPASRPRDGKEIVASHTVTVSEPLIRWLRPKNDLRQLIVAVMGASLQRRSNACGALKVLTMNKKNQLTLMRTDSFLESLVFAASQEITSNDRELALDARTRAVACLRNVCEPKDNRGYLISHPGFKEALGKVIRDDVGEARVIACGAFALLAKAPECREAMVQADGVVDLLAEVMSGAFDAANGTSKIETPASQTLSDDVSFSGDGTLSQDTSLRSKRTSISGREADNEDDDDDDDHSEASEENSSHSSEYSSSSSENNDDDESSHTRGPPVTKGKDRSSIARPVKVDSSNSLPAHADDLVQLNSIRQLNHEMQAEFLIRARSNACAALLHLSKHCAVSVRSRSFALRRTNTLAPTSTNVCALISSNACAPVRVCWKTRWLWPSRQTTPFAPKPWRFCPT